MGFCIFYIMSVQVLIHFADHNLDCASSLFAFYTHAYKVNDVVSSFHSSIEPYCLFKFPSWYATDSLRSQYAHGNVDRLVLNFFCPSRYNIYFAVFSLMLAPIVRWSPGIKVNSHPFDRPRQKHFSDSQAQGFVQT